MFLYLRLSCLLFLSLRLISVSDNFLGTLPWGSGSPVRRKPDLHHLFFIFWKRPLHFLPEGSGGGGASCLVYPFPSPLLFWIRSLPQLLAPGSLELRPSLLWVTVASGIRPWFMIFPPQLTAEWGRQGGLFWSTAGLLIWEKVKIPGTERAQETERFHQWKPRWKIVKVISSASRQSYSQLGCLTCCHRCLFV